VVLNLSNNPSDFLAPRRFVIWDELSHTRSQLRLVHLGLAHVGGIDESVNNGLLIKALLVARGKVIGLEVASRVLA